MARSPNRSPGGGRDGADVIYGRRPVLELLRAGGSAERIMMAEGMARSAVLGEIRRRASDAAVPVKVVPRAEIESAARGTNHQGIVAVTGRYRYAQVEELLGRGDATVLFLDGISDPHNLGSLLRSADAAGFTGVVIPARRSAGVTAAVRRVSAGASETVPVARVTNLGRALDAARGVGMWVLGMEGAAQQDIWSSELMEPPLALVLGSEGRGISKGIRDRCDDFVRIPQAGRIGSLNVAVAGAIAMFEIARRSRTSDTL